MKRLCQKRALEVFFFIGIAVALKQCLSKQFVHYVDQVNKNSQTLVKRLIEHGYHLLTGGTDNHLCLVDLRSKNLDGSRIEKVLDLASIACNKNTCPGDKNAFRPSGIRLGTPALTSRGFEEKDFVKLYEIYKKHDSKASKTNKEFHPFVETDREFGDKIKQLAKEIDEFTEKVEMPGNFDI